MQFKQSLGKKYNFANSAQPQFKKPPVVWSLQTFLKDESQRIDHLIQKKRDHENKLHKISEQNMKQRNLLRQKIEQQQAKHEKNRNQFLTKRVKGQKFKMEIVEQKRGGLQERRKAERKAREQQFKKNKQETTQFWNNREQKLKRSYSTQLSASPLYEEAFYRKKNIENINEEHGILTKQKLLSRHNSVVERIGNKVQEKLIRLEQHSEQIRADQERHAQKLADKNQDLINNYCVLQDRSKSLQKKNKLESEKKLKGKIIDSIEAFSKTHENFTKFHNQRARSMKDCRCHVKGRISNPEEGLTQSINFQSNSPTKKSMTASNWFEIQNKKKGFMMQSQNNFSSVKNNQQTLKEQKQLQDEKRLMREKQISDAVKAREQIRNDSNCLVRQARVIG